MTMRRMLTLFPLLLLAATSAFAGTGKIIIINRDAAGVGFNDPRPVAPVGGNPGTTIGAQRLAVFERAAHRWSTILDTNVDIRVRASFAALPCNDTRVVLGQAGATQWKANFPNAPKQNVLYPIALANKLAGTDLSPDQDDINTQFSSSLDTPTCLGERGWYYGFDGNEGNDSALYPVVLHEIGHGLGMATYTYPDFAGMPSVYDTHILDHTAGLRWDQMTSAQRRISMTNTSNLVWDGANVTAKASQFLDPVTTLTITEPSAVARNYDVGTAGFGPAANRAAMSGPLVAAVDAANTEGPSATDGCTAYSNADAVRGKIALVDRGTCTFVQKALTAQAAGAIGVVLVDNRKETCLAPAMGGTDTSVRIPIVSLTQDDGNALRAQLANATVSGILRVDPSRRSGASSQGYVRLYAPCTLEPGSSISHWDSVAYPNLLMEPSINADLLDTVDISVFQMMDIGWTQPPRTGRRFIRR